MEICYFTFKLVRMYTAKKANYAGSIIFMTFFGKNIIIKIDILT